MMTRFAEPSPQSKARAAGFFWLMTILTGVFALVASGRVVVIGDAAATAANVLAHEALFRAGSAANLVAETRVTDRTVGRSSALVIHGPPVHVARCDFVGVDRRAISVREELLSIRDGLLPGSSLAISTPRGVVRGSWAPRSGVPEQRHRDGNASFVIRDPEG